MKQNRFTGSSSSLCSGKRSDWDDVLVVPNRLRRYVLGLNEETLKELRHDIY